MFSFLTMNVGPEVLQFVGVVIWHHGCLTWLPSSWADFSVLISEVESFDKAQHFVSTSSNWKVVNTVLAKNSVSVDDVGCAESSTLFTASIVNHTSVVSHDLLVDVRHKGDFHWANTTFIAGSHCPALVDEWGVEGASDDLAIVFGKLLALVIELSNLSWADECKVEGPEKQNDVFA